MPLMTWTMELRVDFDVVPGGPDKNDIMLHAFKSAGKQLITTANLISDNRKPQIALTTSDMFVGTEEISLFDDGELEAL